MDILKNKSDKPTYYRQMDDHGDKLMNKNSLRLRFIVIRNSKVLGAEKKYGEDFVMAVIDCTGHGVPGAFMAMTTNAVLGHVLDTMGGEDPAAVLQSLNRLMRATLHPERVDNAVDNGLDIGLCWCSAHGGRIIFAGEGIDLYREAKGKLEQIAGNKQPIGYKRSDPAYTYTNHFITFNDPSWYYLVSDGIFDQPGGEKGWGFGRKRYQALITSIFHLTGKEQMEAIEKAIISYQRDNLQRDDITIIGFKPKSFGQIEEK